jgi:hypothetical protein
MSVSIALSNKMFPKRQHNITRKFYPEGGKLSGRMSSISSQPKGMMELRSPFTPPQIIPRNKGEKESPQRVSFTNEVGVGPDSGTQYSHFYKFAEKSPLQKLVSDVSVNNRNESLNLNNGG